MFDESAIPPDATLEPEQVDGLIRVCVTGSRTYRSGDTIYVDR
jgi:hypothetical protein